MRQASRVRAIACGRVQGVGFRHFVMEQARWLGLVGVCRNLRNGAVEVVAEGERGALEALIVQLKRGPVASNVEQVITVWHEATGEFTTFSIGHTM